MPRCESKAAKSSRRRGKSRIYSPRFGGGSTHLHHRSDGELKLVEARPQRKHDAAEKAKKDAGRIVTTKKPRQRVSSRFMEPQ